MSEKDNGEKFAAVRPLGASINGDMLSVDWHLVASDKETAEEAAAIHSIDLGAESWSIQDLDNDGSPVGRNRTYFSSATWNAPWEPTGQRPNWRTEADPSEPIN